MTGEQPILETVPNVSCSGEHMVGKLRSALQSAGALVADTHADHDHGRTVFTAFGTADQLVGGLSELAAVAATELDLRDATGVHPRTGVLDVVPIVALDPRDHPVARETVQRVAEGIAAAGIPALGYGDGQQLRRTGEARKFAADALGSSEGAAALLHAAERDEGAGVLAMPQQIWGPIEQTGVTLVGTRPILVACNFWFGPFPDDNLVAGARTSLAVVAGSVRETGSGLPGVRTLALALPLQRAAQLSMNLEQPQMVSPAQLFDTVADALLDPALGLTSVHPADPVRFELVGLAPEHWLTALRTECSRRDLPLDAADWPIEWWAARVRPPDV